MINFVYILLRYYSNNHKLMAPDVLMWKLTDLEIMKPIFLFYFTWQIKVLPNLHCKLTFWIRFIYVL